MAQSNHNFEIQFDRVSLLRRTPSLARIITPTIDSRGLGGPGDGRDIPWRWGERIDACGVMCEGVSNSSSTSTVARQPTSSDLRLNRKKRDKFNSPASSDKRVYHKMISLFHKGGMPE